MLIEIRYSPDDWMPKRELVFVMIAGRLCWPINLYHEPALISQVLATLERMIDTNRMFLARGMDWYIAKSVLPVQQPFHSGRLRGFQVITPKEVRRRLRIEQPE